MCLFCNCFGPKKSRKKKKSSERTSKKTSPPGRTTMAMYDTNWEENLGINPNLSPSQIDDSTFSKNINVSSKKFKNRFDLFKDILKNYETTGVKYVFLSDRALGKGGFGSVYRIQNFETKEIFALKAMKIKTEGNIKVNRFSAFKLEVFSLKKISHRNIIKIIDHFIVDAVFISFMILEFATEGDLNHRLRVKYQETRKPFPEKEVLRYFAQMANAINCIHSHKIAHKDLKLDNVLITKINDREVIKVTDFGCAKVAINGVVMEENAAGTVIYMAPETLKVYVCQGLKLSKLIPGGPKLYNPFKADIWSLGVCLYRLLYYEFPFKYDPNKIAETIPPMIKSMKTIPKPPKDMTQTVSPECLNLLSGLLVYQKNQRLTLPNVMKHNWIISSPEADTYNPILADRQIEKKK